ncbi:MAG: group III truncated hemoglobin [Niabella sp.]
MKPDISNRADIEKLIYLFYEKVKQDEVIGFFFSDIVAVNWEKHLPTMCDFWENVLFYSGKYDGNPLATHRRINQLHPTNSAHFEHWINLFDEAVDSLFEGANADKIKQRSKAIAAVMQQKIDL